MVIDELKSNKIKPNWIPSFPTYLILYKGLECSYNSVITRNSEVKGFLHIPQIKLAS